MPVSERIEAKAARYLGEGRLTVRKRDGFQVQAVCQGGGAEPYELGHDPDSGYWCACPAVGECAHLRALRLVVASSSEAVT